jgi:hypothetical protein
MFLNFTANPRFPFAKKCPRREYRNLQGGLFPVLGTNVGGFEGLPNCG